MRKFPENHEMAFFKRFLEAGQTRHLKDKITCNNNIRLREILAKVFINFVKISFNKCCIRDTIQLGIPTGIWNSLSHYFIAIDMFYPDKAKASEASNVRSIKANHTEQLLDIHLLESVRPMVPVPQNRSRTISEPSPLRPAQSSISLYNTSAWVLLRS